jgi:uncharacterized repeat protein (TIGR04042 family)
MPELRFAVRWPDGSRDLCYSPSTIIRDYFTPGAQYSVSTFVEQCRSALGAASERVRERYGVPCSQAMGQLARIEATAERFADTDGAVVEFETFLP